MNSGVFLDVGWSALYCEIIGLLFNLHSMDVLFVRWRACTKQMNEVYERGQFEARDLYYVC